MLRSLRKAAESLERSVDVAFSNGDTSGSTEYVGREYVINGQRIQLGRVFAEGGFSFVHSARPANASHTSTVRYAVKRISCEDEESERRVRHEFRFLQQIPAHPNIANFLGGLVSPPLALLAFDMIDGGTLAENLTTNPPSNPADALDIFADAAAAVAHLHAQDPPIASRDLKLENLLWDRMARRYRLCDFGSCTTVAKRYANRSEILKAEDEISEHSSAMYRAPEMVDLYRRQFVCERVDVWALGCVWYAILFGKLPYDGQSTIPILKGTLNIPDTPQYPPAFIKLLKAMLTVNPAERTDSFTVLEAVRRLQDKPFDPALRARGAKLRTQRERDFSADAPAVATATSEPAADLFANNVSQKQETRVPSVARSVSAPANPSPAGNDLFSVSSSAPAIENPSTFASDFFGTSASAAEDSNEADDNTGWADFSTAFGEEAGGNALAQPATVTEAPKTDGFATFPARTERSSTIATAPRGSQPSAPLASFSSASANLQQSRPSTQPLSANLGALYSAKPVQNTSAPAPVQENFAHFGDSKVNDNNSSFAEFPPFEDEDTSAVAKRAAASAPLPRFNASAPLSSQLSGLYASSKTASTPTPMQKSAVPPTVPAVSTDMRKPTTVGLSSSAPLSSQLGNLYGARGNFASAQTEPVGTSAQNSTASARTYGVAGAGGPLDLSMLYGGLQDDPAEQNARKKEEERRKVEKEEADREFAQLRNLMGDVFGKR